MAVTSCLLLAAGLPRFMGPRKESYTRTYDRFDADKMYRSLAMPTKGLHAGSDSGAAWYQC